MVVMAYQLNSIVLANSANGLLALFVMAVCWRRRALPGALHLLALMASIFVWLLFAVLETSARDPGTKVLWASFEYFGLTATPLAYLWLSLQFNTRILPVSRRHGAILLGMALGFCLLAFTNARHHLVWTAFHPAPMGQLEYVHGWAYGVFLAYSYGIYGVASLRMVYAIVNFPRHYWQLGMLLLLALAMPLMASFAYVLGLVPKGIDPTPMGLSFTGLCLAVGLLRTRLLDITPVAREQLVERMREGMLVLDSLRRVVDFNPAAVTMMRHVPSIGEAAEGLPEPWNGMAAELVPGEDRVLEFGPLRNGRWVEARISPLFGIAERSQGHLVILYDIARRKELERELERLAHRDPLTGLANRRSLSMDLAREIARCRRAKLPLALLMIDVDHFKSVNDSFGHAGGDEVLRRLGELLQGGLRREDHVCRWGGEEFVAILSGCGRSDAMARAETLRCRLQELPIPWEGREIRVTMSVGIAMFPDCGEGDALLEAGDKALYRSKREGRNRISAVPEPSGEGALN